MLIHHPGGGDRSRRHHNPQDCKLLVSMEDSDEFVSAYLDIAEATQLRDYLNDAINETAR